MKYRITTDLDFKTKIDFIRKIKLFLTISKAYKYIEKITRIEIYKSHSKGYHLVIFTDKFYPRKKENRIRYLLSDDKNRIRLDRNRKIGRQTLFNKKYKVKNKIERRFKK